MLLILSAMLSAMLLTACGGGSERSTNPWTEAPQGGVAAAAALPPALRPDARRHALAAVTRQPDATALFDWAERAFPQYFSGHATNQSLGGYVYRYYGTTGNYLGVSGDTVAVLGPLTGNVVANVGRLADFGCSVYPRECAPSPGALAIKPRPISAAVGHTLAAGADGRVLSWGSFAPSTPMTALPGTGAKIVGGLVSVAAVFAGAGYDIALRSDGSVWLWGLDSEGRKTTGGAKGNELIKIPAVVPGLPPVVQVSACNAVLFALAADGTVWITPGKLVGDRRPPQQVRGLRGVKALGEGTCEPRLLAVRDDGSVVGLLYDDAAARRGDDPVRVDVLAALADVEEVSCQAPGTQTACLALTRDRRVLYWLNGDLTALKVLAVPPARRIAAGGKEMWVLAEDGSVHAVSYTRDPVVQARYPAERGIAEISASRDGVQGFYTALLRDGTVWSWGGGTYAGTIDSTVVQRGDWQQIAAVNLDACSVDLRECPVSQNTVPLSARIRPAAVGMFGRSTAIASDGRVLAWGASDLEPAALTPIAGSPAGRVASIAGAAGVVSNDSATLVVTTGGELWAWGSHNGELDGTAFGEPRVTRVPTRVPGFARIVDAHHGCRRIIALRDDGVLLVSPSANSLATGGPIRPAVLAGLSGIVALGSGYAAGGQGCGVHALQADGSAWLVKASDRGLGNSVVLQEGVPALDDVSCSLVTSSATCLGRARDGRVWSWGLVNPVPKPMHESVLKGARQATASGHVVLGDGSLYLFGFFDSRIGFDGTVHNGMGADSLVRLAAAGVSYVSDDGYTVLMRDGSLWRLNVLNRGYLPVEGVLGKTAGIAMQDTGR